MYIPSYDFTLFKIPNFSPLEAGEYNAMTKFSANTPLQYVDYSINQLAGLMQPNNPNPYSQRQFPSEIIPTELQNFFQTQKDRIEVYPSGTLPPELRGKSSAPVQSVVRKCDANSTWFDRITGRCCIGEVVNGECQLRSDGQDVMGDKEAPVPLAALQTFLNGLPAGSGIFLIAVIVIVLLFLFVKR